ncbi:MAG TPA: hypothetical protein VE988_10335 [Gemmataceae bacterium]|nr:hypothetical protein [Gemmataceae bacterium]
MSLFATGDCWNGGGLFLSDKEFWLNDGHGHTALKTARDVRLHADYQPPGLFGGECLTVYYNRLQRDGWVMGIRRGIDEYVWMIENE